MNLNYLTLSRKGIEHLMQITKWFEPLSLKHIFVKVAKRWEQSPTNAHCEWSTCEPEIPLSMPFGFGVPAVK